MAMALVDDFLTIDVECLGALLELARVRAQTHGAALFVDIFLIGHNRNNLILGILIELRRRRTRQADNVARELAHGSLQAQANAEVGHVVRAGVTRSRDFTLKSALAKTARHQNAVHGAKQLFGSFVVDLFRINEVQVHVHAICHARMMERFHNGEIRIGKLHVFAHDGNVHFALAIGLRREELAQRSEVDVFHGKAQLREHLLVEMLVMQREGHRINTRRVNAREHIARVNVAEQGDFVANARGNLVVAAAYDEVGLHANAAQLFDGMLRGLGFHLVSRGDVRNQRHMHENHVAGFFFLLELASGLDERLALDVAHRAADFGNNDIGVRLARDAIEALFNSVGHMRNNLHGATQEIAATLAGDEALIDRALGEVGVAREAFVDKALVMAQVKVAFMAIVGHEHLAMLKRAHRARVDVEVRVDFLHGHMVSAGFQKMPERCRRNALAQRRNHAARHENVLGHDAPLRLSCLLFTTCAAPKYACAQAHASLKRCSILRARRQEPHAIAKECGVFTWRKHSRPHALRRALK